MIGAVNTILHLCMSEGVGVGTVSSTSCTDDTFPYTAAAYDFYDAVDREINGQMFYGKCWLIHGWHVVVLWAAYLPSVLSTYHHLTLQFKTFRSGTSWYRLGNSAMSNHFGRNLNSFLTRERMDTRCV